MYELQEMLKAITGMRGVALSPMAGAHGEFAGVAMIRAYHRARGDLARDRDHRAAGRARHQSCDRDHVRLCGARSGGRAPMAMSTWKRCARRWAPNTAGIMLTNPSTLGVFERRIEEVARIVHQAGGLLYYDGANLNAILGKVRPGDMGFDAIHMNLHKTFSTPHGGGGPGAGAVGVSARLLPFLPLPIVGTRGRRASSRCIAGWASVSCRSRSAGSPASAAMPGCCCAPTSTCACWAARACGGLANMPP